MVRIKLSQLAQRLGKSITEIAQETGLNRNAVTALVHGKVDGIKFSTLEKICQTYGVGILDVLELELPEPVQTIRKLYKQEGSIVPFTCWPWVIAINSPDKKWFPVTFSTISTYFSEEYGMGYWDWHNLYEVSKYAYQRYSDATQGDRLYRKYHAAAKAIEDLYMGTDATSFLADGAEAVSHLMNRIWKLYGQFWAYSLFIDSFDAGFDHEEIGRIATKYKLSGEEVGVLTTPVQPTFNNERQLEFLKIVRTIARKRKTKKIAPIDEVRAVLQGMPAVHHYIKQYDYYASTYAQVKHLTLDTIAEDALEYLRNPELLESEHNRLSAYSEEQEKKTKAVLRAHRLKENPLEFFARLTYWREHRKQVNLMGIHLLDLVLRGVEQASGIPYKFLQYLSYEEVDGAMKGLVTKGTLQRRREQGVVIICDGGAYKIIEGQEALSLQRGLEHALHVDSQDEVSLDLKGNVASQGYAKGIAKIVMDQNDFTKVEEGDILVTGMTRPEFVPVMKKAAGIVTNEGGITCHAAIVSRELGKPCIIGTKKATQVIKDGDLVEVRANHGTVRIVR